MAGSLCYANHRTLTYGRSDNPDYYNLEFELSGTDLPISDESRSMRVRKVRGKEIFRFDNGKYVRIFRQGDMTAVEVLAEKQKDHS
jgi:hypothetical protein